MYYPSLILFFGLTFLPCSALADATDSLPGLPVPPSPVYGALDPSDPMDIYWVHLAHGQKLVTNLWQNGELDSYCSLYIQPSNAPAISRDFEVGYQSFAPAIGEDGDYSIVLEERDGIGPQGEELNVDYKLAWKIIPADPDDTLPGVPIPPSPIHVTLRPNNFVDVYSIYLRHGDMLVTTDTTGIHWPRPLIFPPGAKLNQESLTVGEQIQTNKIDQGWYFAPAIDKDGTYSLALYYGDYTCNWRVIHAQPDDAIPGIPAPPSPIIGGFNPEDSDFVDIYRFHLNAGQKLHTSGGGDQNGGYGRAFLVGSIGSRTGLYRTWPLITYGPDISYAPPPGQGGDYYLVIQAGEFASNYRVDYEITPADPEDNVPGFPLPPSPIRGFLAPATHRKEVYAIDLKTSQVMNVFYDSTSYDIIGGHYFSPQCSDAISMEPQNSGEIDRRYLSDPYDGMHDGLIAPRDGRYYLAIGTHNGGDINRRYGFRYFKVLANNFSKAGYRVSWMNLNNTPYIDRTYSLSSIPDWLRGQVLVKTPCNDKNLTSVMSFNVDVPVEVVVAFNENDPPDWLKSWRKLSDKVVLTGDIHPNRVLYAKALPAGKITLGGNRDSDMPTGASMYFVILLPPRTIPGLTNHAETWTMYP